MKEEKQPTPMDFSKFPRVCNREEARAFEKLLRKSGKSKDEIADIIKLSKALAKSFEAESQTQYKQSLCEGDTVKLDIDKMRSYPDWDKRQEAYIEYVNANIDTIFSVRLIEKYQGNNASVFFPPGKTGCARPPSCGDNIVNLVDESDTISPWQFSSNDLLVYDKKDSAFKAMWLIEEETS